MAMKVTRAKAVKPKTKAVAKKATPRAKAKPAKAKKPEFQKVAFTMFEVEDPKRARNFYDGSARLHARAGGAERQVSDLDATPGRLQAAGVRFLGDIILDSEGNSIILHQRNR
ncbi:MAG: hypothetical protein SFX73_00570 [Kofleriaceae bacterium]|nr:hypothetical protein [Kofleriaceae bacterium]